MTTQPTEFSNRVARAVKAELARRDLSGHDLAEPLKMGRNAVYARLRYEKAFNTDELEATAEFLGITLETLFASANLSAAEPPMEVATAA